MLLLMWLFKGDFLRLRSVMILPIMFFVSTFHYQGDVFSSSRQHFSISWLTFSIFDDDFLLFDHPFLIFSRTLFDLRSRPSLLTLNLATKITTHTFYQSSRQHLQKSTHSFTDQAQTPTPTPTCTLYQTL